MYFFQSSACTEICVEEKYTSGLSFNNIIRKSKAVFTSFYHRCNDYIDKEKMLTENEPDITGFKTAYWSKWVNFMQELEHDVTVS